MNDTMGQDQFWDLIAQTTAFENDPERQLQALDQALSNLSADDIQTFERAFQAEQKRAYSWDLWGAAYVIHGGCSDDGFEYFQRWLISKGRKVFDAAVNEADALGDLPAVDTEKFCEFEAFATVASNVWWRKTGVNPWEDLDSTFPYTGAPPAPEPSGTAFSQDPQELAKRYPRLWARFRNDGDGMTVTRIR